MLFTSKVEPESHFAFPLVRPEVDNRRISGHVLGARDEPAATNFRAGVDRERQPIATRLVVFDQ